MKQIKRRYKPPQTEVFPQLIQLLHSIKVSMITIYIKTTDSLDMFTDSLFMVTDSFF